MDKKSGNILFDIDLKAWRNIHYPPTGYILYIFYIGTVPCIRGSNTGVINKKDLITSGSITKSSVTFRMQKKIFFIFVLRTCSSLYCFKIVKICLIIEIKFWARKFFLRKLYFATIISVYSTLEKREGFRSGSILTQRMRIWECPKTYGSGSGTLFNRWSYLETQTCSRPNDEGCMQPNQWNILKRKTFAVCQWWLSLILILHHLWYKKWNVMCLHGAKVTLPLLKHQRAFHFYIVCKPDLVGSLNILKYWL